MILSELKAYLKEHRRASIADMANRFDTPPQALRGMLAQFERKGRVRHLVATEECSGCSKCDAATSEVYEWLE